MLAGNAVVDVLNNYWISLTIQATHFTEPLQPEDALNHKGHWYLTQLDSSVNFKGSRRMSILWGHLNYQVEHHLFPDIPSHHYPDMAKEVNATLRFFLGILPPVMAGIMAGGGLLVWLILSKAFLPVAALLLIFVPAELMRILAETILTQFLARRRLRLYAAIYLAQFLCFVGVATLLVPVLGVAGAALAYFASMAMTLLGALFATRWLFGFAPELATLRWAALSVLLLGGVVMACLQIPEGLVRYGTCVAFLGAWLLLAFRDSEFRRVAAGLLAKISALGGR